MPKSEVETTAEIKEDLKESEEISEEDLRDPFKQYQRFKNLSDAAWSNKIPSIDEAELREVASDIFAEDILNSIEEGVSGEYYFDDPEGYEDAEFSEITFASQEFYKTDENGLPEYFEGSTVQFKICEVDDSITKNSKTGEIISSSDEELDTFEYLVQMVFENGKWKLEGQDILKRISGEVKCEFQE